eukprot:9482392-Pyramimonas_sp.AAC.1
MYAGIALSRGTSSQSIQTPRPRHSILAVNFLTIYLGIVLSLETSSRFMQDARFSNLPARPGRLGPPSRPACWGLPARSSRLVRPR